MNWEKIEIDTYDDDVIATYQCKDCDMHCEIKQNDNWPKPKSCWFPRHAYLHGGKNDDD